MTGISFVISVKPKVTPEENEAFAMEHLANHGKAAPPQKTAVIVKMFRAWIFLFGILVIYAIVKG